MVSGTVPGKSAVIYLFIYTGSKKWESKVDHKL